MTSKSHLNKFKLFGQFMKCCTKKKTWVQKVKQLEIVSNAQAHLTHICAAAIFDQTRHTVIT